MSDSTAPFLGGVVEGFYGRPWNSSQRRQLFAWLKAAGLNAYMYAPKDDIKHRALWRDLYDGAEVEELRSLIRDCAAAGLQFIYALSPGLDMRFSQAADRDALKAKLAQVHGLGAPHFAVLWDDIPEKLSEADAREFGTPAAAQCAATNDAFAHVRQLSATARVLFCPTIYCARFADHQVPKNEYLRIVGEQLTAEIDVLWTGPEIISEAISVESIRELRAVIRRRPVIWDNLHANDYDMRRLYLGPYSGRALELRSELAGILLNPNCQIEANFVGVRTLGMYVNAQHAYAPRAAYLAATEAWLPEFQSRGRTRMSLADVRLMGDLYYLPTEQGERAQRFLDDLRALVRTPPNSWGEALARAEQTGREIAGLYEKITELANRDLCYALYAHLWEMKETVQLCGAWLNWRRNHPTSTERFASGEFRNRIWRGGPAATIDRLLTMDDEGRFVPN
jgi:protein O-GlcNAcase/histone acetyltransferase